MDEQSVVLTSPPITAPIGFKWEMPDYFGVDARVIGLSQYFCPVAQLGSGNFYFGTFHDHNGNPLEGGSTYRLHVPANVPVREFWSLTIYSLTTSGFFRVYGPEKAIFDKSFRLPDFGKIKKNTDSISAKTTDLL